MKKPYYVTSEEAKRILVASSAQIFSAFVISGLFNGSNEKELVTKSVQIAIEITQEVSDSVKTVSR
jgi:hypothetical protein